MTSTYLDDLGKALTSAGIPRRRRNRIVAEFADHLHQQPDADLGVPAALAGEFAHDLGRRLARRTAINTSVGMLLLLVPLTLTLALPAVNPPGARQIGSGGWPSIAILATTLFLIDAVFTLSAGALVLWRTRDRAPSPTKPNLATFRRWSRANYWAAWCATLGIVFVYETPSTRDVQLLALLASATLLAWGAPSIHTLKRLK